MDIQLSADRIPGRVILRIPIVILYVMTLLFVGSCNRQSGSVPRILREGDAVNGMVLTSGATNALPLEAFCSFEADEDAINTIDCQVPPFPKLAIGHMIGLTGGTFQELDWSEIDWQVYLDGYLLDLDTFDVQSYVEPEIPSSPSPIREVFKQRKTWDIVLINPTFGLHTLVCTAKTNSVVYNWVVNFMINSTRGPLNMVERPPG